MVNGDIAAREGGHFRSCAGCFFGGTAGASVDPYVLNGGGVMGGFAWLCVATASVVHTLSNHPLYSCVPVFLFVLTVLNSLILRAPGVLLKAYAALHGVQDRGKLA